MRRKTNLAGSGIASTTTKHCTNVFVIEDIRTWRKIVINITEICLIMLGMFWTRLIAPVFELDLLAINDCWARGATYHMFRDPTFVEDSYKAWAWRHYCTWMTTKSMSSDQGTKSERGGEAVVKHTSPYLSLRRKCYWRPSPRYSMSKSIRSTCGVPGISMRFQIHESWRNGGHKCSSQSWLDRGQSRWEDMRLDWFWSRCTAKAQSEYKLKRKWFPYAVCWVRSSFDFNAIDSLPRTSSTENITACTMSYLSCD